MAEENVYVNMSTVSKHDKGSHHKSSPAKSNTKKKVAIGILIVVLVVAVIGIVIVYAPCTIRLDCDTGWEPNGTMCYNFSSTKSSWNQSRKTCQDLGGDLVKIDSREEQTFLFHKVRGLMNESDDSEDKFWIGLTDAEAEGEWKWVDGSPLNQSLTFWFRNKDKEEPDDWKRAGEYPEGEDCTHLGELGREFEEKCWFDRFCAEKQRFICEKGLTRSPVCQ